METNQELIKEARSRAALCAQDSREAMRDTGDIVTRLADALEAATAVEPEWEYGTAHREDPGAGALEWSRARAEERAREWNEATRSVTGVVVRRRPAGPWLPVEGENTDEA